MSTTLTATSWSPNKKGGLGVHRLSGRPAIALTVYFHRQTIPLANEDDAVYTVLSLVEVQATVSFRHLPLGLRPQGEGECQMWLTLRA